VKIAIGIKNGKILEMTILTIDQAAELIKFSKAYIYKHIRKIPHYKVDERLRFSEEKLLAWLESKEAGPEQEALMK